MKILKQDIKNLKPIDSELEELFKKADKIKPIHNLTPEEMDELNERLMS